MQQTSPQRNKEWVASMLIKGKQHGFVSQLSRESQVSRQTLYRWEAAAKQAVQEALSPRLAEAARGR